MQLISWYQRENIQNRTLFVWSLLWWGLMTWVNVLLLQVSERTESGLDNLHLCLTLWDGVLHLETEVSSWTNHKLAAFAQSPYFENENEIETLKVNIELWVPVPFPVCWCFLKILFLLVSSARDCDSRGEYWALPQKNPGDSSTASQCGRPSGTAGVVRSSLSSFQWLLD